MVLGDSGPIVDLAEYMGHHGASVTLRIYGHIPAVSEERTRAIVGNRMFRPRAVSGGDPAR